MLRCMRLLLIGTIAYFALFVGPAQAVDTVTVTFGADPTEEVPLPITAAWSSTDSSVRVRVTVKPAGGLACAANFAADNPNSNDVIYTSGTTSGSTSENETFSEPGVFTLCGYLEDPSTDAVLMATGPLTLAVRSAAATVALAVPPRVDPGQTFAVTAYFTAELSRSLFVTVKPAGGRGCEPSYAADSPNSRDVIYTSGVQGTGNRQENFTASDVNGNYLLCSYVQEGSSDTAPEAVNQALFAVGPDPCAAARSALAAAKRKLRSIQTSVTRNRKAVARYTSAARRGSRASRRLNRARLSSARKRYRSAVTRRVAARKSVAKRTTAVRTACG